ncbi:MAG: hypothetical protein ACI4N3_05010 [Alphaproteobacteria bacterium]
MLQTKLKTNENLNASFDIATKEVSSYLNKLNQTSSTYKKQDLSKKPAQSSNDLEVLLSEANYVKPVIDYTIPVLLKKFEKTSSYIFSDELTPNTISFIPTNNKGKERISQKISEPDVGKFENILDYVRCTVSFPNVETLFNFVKFANEFKFKGEDFKDFEFADKLFGLPKAVFGVNNFAIDNLNDEKLATYPFLKEKINLKYTEFMDYKLYIKVPLHDNNYMIAEILCTLHEFTQYYGLTHFLYEYARDIAKLSNILPVSSDLIEKYFKALIAYIHQSKVISPYNNKALDSYHLATKQGQTGEYIQDLKKMPHDVEDMLYTRIVFESGDNTNKNFTKDLANILAEFVTNERS